MIYQRPSCVTLGPDNVLRCSVCQGWQQVQECLPVAELLRLHDSFNNAHAFCSVVSCVSCAGCRRLVPPDRLCGQEGSSLCSDCCHHPVNETGICEVIR